MTSVDFVNKLNGGKKVEISRPRIKHRKPGAPNISKATLAWAAKNIKNICFSSFLNQYSFLRKSMKVRFFLKKIVSCTL